MMKKHRIPGMLTLLLALTPMQVRADAALGEKLVREGEYAKALEAMQGDEATPEVCFWRGRALVPLERMGEAAFNFEKVPQGHPLFPYAAKGLIHCAWKSNFINFVEAVAPLTACEDPEVAGLATAAMAEFQLRHTKEGDTSALQELRRMAEGRPELLPVLQLLEIEDLRTQGKYEEAKTAAQAIAEKRDLPQPMRHRARLALAEVYYGQNETGMGEETLLQFIAANPDSPLLDEAFRRLVLHRAFTSSAYAVDRLKDWSMEYDHPHRTSLALLMQQRAALAGNAKDTNLTTLATSAASKPEDPAARTVVMEHVRMLLEQGRKQEAARFLDFVKNPPDARTRFLEAACLPDTSAEALQMFLECLDCAPAELQPAAAANAIYCAYQCGDPATVEALLGKDLPRHARRVMLLMYATLTQENNPAAALQALHDLEGLAPTPEQEAEATLIHAAIEVDSRPVDTLQSLKELVKSGKTDSWSDRHKLRLYMLLMESLDRTPSKLRAVRENGEREDIAMAKEILETAKSDLIRTEFTFVVASKLTSAGRLHEAMVLLEKLAASATEPETKARALLLAAEKAAGLGSMEYFNKALDLFKQCTDIPSPYQARAYIHRANVLMWINRCKEAERTLTDLLRKEDELSRNDKILAYTTLADVYSMQGTSESRDSALQVSDQALALPDLTPAWKARILLQHAALSARYGMHSRALADYKELLGTTPESGRHLTKAQWYILNYAGAGAIYELIQLKRTAEAAELAEKVADWLSLCPAGIAESLGLEKNIISFRHWADAIRATP